MLLFFYRKNEFIFCFDNYIINNYAFEFRRFCISQSLVNNIFVTVHDAINDYANFCKCYKQLIFFYYVRGMFKQLRNYLRHCSNCQIH